MSNPEKPVSEKKSDDAKEELTPEELDAVAGGIIAVNVAVPGAATAQPLGTVPTVGIDAAVIPRGGALP